MPLVLPTLYLVKSMVKLNSAPKLRRFQLKKIAFVNTIVLTSTIAACEPKQNNLIHEID